MVQRGKIAAPGSRSIDEFVRMDKGTGNTPQEIITGVKTDKGFLGFVRDAVGAGPRWRTHRLVLGIADRNSHRHRNGIHPPRTHGYPGSVANRPLLSPNAASRHHTDGSAGCASDMRANAAANVLLVTKNLKVVK
jgi:hypothetical protein